jgi:ribosomal protein S18 acetylase RimI-like enzyme
MSGNSEWAQGIALALVRTGEERLKALGATRLTAIVADNEYAAVALWEPLAIAVKRR